LTAINELKEIVKIYEISLQQIDDEVIVLNDGNSQLMDDMGTSFLKQSSQ